MSFPCKCLSALTVLFPMYTCDMIGEDCRQTFLVKFQPSQAKVIIFRSGQTLASDHPALKSRSLSFSLIIKFNHQIVKNLPYFCMLLFHSLPTPADLNSYVQHTNDILIFLKPTFNHDISRLKAFNGCPLPKKLRKTPQFGSQILGLTSHASFLLTT